MTRTPPTGREDDVEEALRAYFLQILQDAHAGSTDALRSAIDPDARWFLRISGGTLVANPEEIFATMIEARNLPERAASPDPQVHSVTTRDDRFTFDADYTRVDGVRVAVTYMGYLTSYGPQIVSALVATKDHG